MTPIADMVRKMLAAGSTVEQILIAIEMIENTSVSRDMSGTESMRAYERERKRRWRQMSGTMSGTKPNTKAKSNGSDGDMSPGHEKRHIEVVSKKESKFIRATRISGTWSLSESDRSWARKQGLSDSEIDGEVPRFKDYWSGKAGKDATKTDWSATWRNWCRNFLEKHPRTGGQSDWRKSIL